MILNRRRESELHELGELPAGTRIGGYEIERLLGSGGMGAVYEATQLALHRRVAVKVISPGVPLNDTLRERFQREAERQAALDHPHILPVHEAGVDHGRPFIAMRLVKGPTLKALIASRELDQATALRILGDIASALDAAHAAGMIHRDVKPQNILIADGDHAYLADFGLSRGSGDETITRSGQLLGSVAYISPEVVRGERATAASDIYSFACVAYECLVGLIPYPYESDHAILHAHAWEPAPRARLVDADLPPAVDGVLADGMAKNPADRPLSAVAFVNQLRQALGLAPEAAPAGNSRFATVPLAATDEDTFVRVPVSPPPKTKHGIGRPLAIGIAAVVAVAGLAGGYVSGRGTSHAADPNPTVKTVPVGPDRTYARQLSSAFARLQAERAPFEKRLREAKSPHGEALALAALATRYDRARARIAALHPQAAAATTNAAIAAALSRVSADYTRLGRAADGNHRATYTRERNALKHDQARLTRAINSLEGLDYRLQ